MMQLDRLTLGRMAKELGFVRDTLEKVCRLADVLKFMESDELFVKYHFDPAKGNVPINAAPKAPRFVKQRQQEMPVSFLIV